MTEPSIRVAVVISSDIEWRALLPLLPRSSLCPSPYGGWFILPLQINGQSEPVLFFHGGWGKISAAASAQYIVDRWAPALLVNLGTCGGFQGAIEKGTIILAERTLVYDIVEQMTDYAESIEHYATDLDLSWLGPPPYPLDVKRTLLISGDRDLIAAEVPQLRERYGAVAGDWESGAIAWVAARNNTRCLILRGVSDLVGAEGGEAYDGNLAVFEEGAAEILARLVKTLPDWIALGLREPGR